MRRLASSLVASVLVAVPSCERTVLHTPAAGNGGTMALGRVTGGGGAPALGGIVDTGGSPPSSGGVLGHGGIQATAGQIGAGGEVSGAGGSGPDTCSSDADCTPCLWAPAPTDPSISCVEGRCIFTCPPNNDASPDVHRGICGDHGRTQHRPDRVSKHALRAVLDILA